MPFDSSPISDVGAESIAKRLITFINIGHALDHFVLLIYPTAVIVLAKEKALDYAHLLTLSTGAFVAFGVLSLPVGFIANWIGRRAMFAAYFFGTALACAGLATTDTSLGFTIWLLILGSFAAIYHPVGGAMLVANAGPGKLGRTLGVNGVWGNLGAAFAPVVTAGLAYTFGWRAAFYVPAIIAGMTGLAFLTLVPHAGHETSRYLTGPKEEFPRKSLYIILAAFMIAVAAGGATFNMISVAMPKVIDERLGLPLPLWLIGSLATIVFLLGAVTQLNMGRLIERQPLPRLFLILAVFQPVGFIIASQFTGIPLLIGLLMAIAAIYGNVVVVDAIVARYVPDKLRTKAYGLRYFLGFAASGFAVPLIASLHKTGGFPLALGVAAGFGACLLASALVIYRLMTPRGIAVT